MNANDRAVLEEIVARARVLPGKGLFDWLMKKHQSGKRSATPPQRPHRLVHLVDRVQRVLDLSDRGGDAVDFVAFRELHAAVGLFDAWPHEVVMDTPEISRLRMGTGMRSC